MKSRTIAALVAALAANACTNLASIAPYKFDLQPGEAGAPREEAQLYARDGSTVQQGTTTTGEVASRALGPSESGRTYILELYQKAIDERDALRGELDTLSAELAGAKAELARNSGQVATLQARIADLEAENQRRLDENVDLAARLVTAQIRRLQAEKVLLEARVAQQQPVAARTEEHK